MGHGDYLMADSVMDQAADLIASQVKTIADGTASWLVPESSITPRRFDWQDIAAHPGVSVRYPDNPAKFANITQDTNAATNVAYPIYVVVHWDTGPNRDARAKAVHSFLQEVRKYYHHKRTLGGVSATGVRENSTTVRNGGPEPPEDLAFNGAIDILTIMCWFLEDKS